VAGAEGALGELGRCQGARKGKSNQLSPAAVDCTQSWASTAQGTENKKEDAAGKREPRAG
jgi:hypothetical protein